MIEPGEFSNIVLTGFMGTGKTTVGKKLASVLQFEFIDTDELIQQKTGISISEIFKNHGEKYFRNLEKEILLSLKCKNTVISTGGGIVKTSANRKKLFKLGFVVNLKTDFEKIYKRVEGTHIRPLFKNKNKALILYNNRLKLYKECHYSIDNTKLNQTECADLICNVYKNSFIYSNPYKKTAVFVKKNIIANIENYIQTINPSKTVIVTDSNISELYSNLIKKLKLPVLVLKPGEENKNMESICNIYNFLNQNKINRNSLLVSLGGGVLSDLAGFAASTFKRGIKYMSIPTTLLSMIDASCGGKTGFNFENTKNMIGSFYQPDIILIDRIFLKTLSKENLKSGYGEFVKYQLLDKTTDDYEITDSNIIKILKYKLKIVEKDELDKEEIRELLNLGHTFGHAIETLSVFSINHGEAVVEGIYMAYKLAFLLKKIPKKPMKETFQILKKAGFEYKNYLKNFEFNNIWDILLKDKKNLKNYVSFILPSVKTKTGFEKVEITYEIFNSKWSELK